MFGRSKNEEVKQLAEERKKMLLRYSNMVRAVSEPFGPNDLPQSGVIDPEVAEVVLRRILATDATKPKTPVEAGVENRPLPGNVCRVELTGPLSARVTRGANPEVKLSCSDSSYLSKVTTEVNGDTVRIGLKPMSYTLCSMFADAV